MPHGRWATVPQKRNSSVSLQDAQVSARKLLDYPGAREAFETITQKCGNNGDELLQLLLDIPSKSRKKQPLVEGTTDRTLRTLPRRMREWADEVERVNRSPFLDPNPEMRGPTYTDTALPLCRFSLITCVKTPK